MTNAAGPARHVAFDDSLRWLRLEDLHVDDIAEAE
jgi:hypothetical protein